MLPSGTRRMPTIALRAVIERMLEADELASTPTRERLIMNLPVEIRSAVEFSGNPRQHVIDLVRTEGISKSLRDDYAAFSLAAIS